MENGTRDLGLGTWDLGLGTLGPWDLGTLNLEHQGAVWDLEPLPHNKQHTTHHQELD